MSDDVLAVIPARGGSKRLPKKNIRELDNKPLIAHAIKDAKSASTVDKVVVSTEDEEIKSVATEYGGNVPFTRPERLATDTATADQVVRHVLTEYKQEGREFDIVCMVFVTTPFRRPTDIDNAVTALRETTARSVVGVTDFDHPPFYAVEADDDNNLSPYFDEEYLWSITRSQDFPSVYRPNGAIFVAEVDALFKHKNFYTDQTKGYFMSIDRSIDIDTMHDLKLARALKQYDEKNETSTDQC